MDYLLSHTESFVFLLALLVGQVYTAIKARQAHRQVKSPNGKTTAEAVVDIDARLKNVEKIAREARKESKEAAVTSDATAAALGKFLHGQGTPRSHRGTTGV